MRQATAYVDVSKADVYDVYYPQEYFISPDKKRVRLTSDGNYNNG